MVLGIAAGAAGCYWLLKSKKQAPPSDPAAEARLRLQVQQAKISQLKADLAMAHLDELRDAVIAKDRPRATSAKQGLVSLGTWVFPAIREIMERNAWDEYKLHLIEVVASIQSTESIEFLEEAYFAPFAKSAAVKQGLAVALARQNSPLARESLVKIQAFESDPEIRKSIPVLDPAPSTSARAQAEHAAAIQAADPKSEAGYQTLLEYLRPVYDQCIRLQALNRLALAPERSIATLKKTAIDPGPDAGDLLRTNALAALCRDESHDALEAYAALLNHEDAKLRGLAASIAGSCGSETLIPSLRKLKDSDASSAVRESAAKAIAQIEARYLRRGG